MATIAVAATTSACGDGRPAFCNDLADASSMTTLSRALDRRDLDAARDAAADFRSLADGAPDGVRGDLTDLADAVSEIVDVVATERSASAATTDPSTTDSTGSETSGSETSGTGDAAALQQQRDRLNDRLADLSTASSRVERWAREHCGIDLR